MNTPEITVLMPVYNGEKYLREAIDSILNQTFSNFEFLIINDGSTDATEEIISGYQDTRIRYIKNESNIKLIASLNKGIALATGKYIARMDTDDVALPNRLQKQFDFMEQNTDVALCGTGCQIFGDENKTVIYCAGHDEIMAKMLYQCHFIHPTMMMRKSMINTFETKFDTHFIHAEDYDFFTRVGEKFKLANIQEVLLRYRIHSQNISELNRATQNAHSATIKKRLFKNLGVDITEPELILYESISHYEYKHTAGYISGAEQLLHKMLAANNVSGYFEKHFFTALIASHWWNVCYHSTRLGHFAFSKYFQSSLPLQHSKKSGAALKFYLKSFFKK